MSSTKCFSLWDYIVLASVPYIQKARINSMRDVLDYEVNFEYPYHLSNLGDLNPANAVNYGFTDIDTWLETRQMIDSVSMHWVMPELLWGVSEPDNVGGDHMHVQPYYFNETQFSFGAKSAGTAGNYGQGLSVREGESAAMSYPVLREGIRLSYLDKFYSMDQRSMRLSLDRMTRCPYGPSISDNQKVAVYKYGQSSDGIPVVQGKVTIANLLSTPREMGFTMRAPYGTLRVADNIVIKSGNVPSSVLTNMPGVYGFASFAGDSVSETSGVTPALSFDQDIYGQSCFRLYAWKGVKTVGNAILDEAHTNINRAQAFRQFWDCRPAALLYDGINKLSSSDYKSKNSLGLALSINDIFDQAEAISSGLKLVPNESMFIPFTNGSASSEWGYQEKITADKMSIISLQKYFWTRLQKLPMILSPWDVCDENASFIPRYDIFDWAHFFGLAGFLASDYNQDVYDRINQIQSQGYLFISDPFVDASPIIQEAKRYTDT